MAKFAVLFLIFGLSSISVAQMDIEPSTTDIPPPIELLDEITTEKQSLPTEAITTEEVETTTTEPEPPALDEESTEKPTFIIEATTTENPTLNPEITTITTTTTSTTTKLTTSKPVMLGAMTADTEPKIVKDSSQTNRKPDDYESQSTLIFHSTYSVWLFLLTAIVLIAGTISIILFAILLCHLSSTRKRLKKSICRLEEELNTVHENLKHRKAKEEAQMDIVTYGSLSKHNTYGAHSTLPRAAAEVYSSAYQTVPIPNLNQPNIYYATGQMTGISSFSRNGKQKVYHEPLALGNMGSEYEPFSNTYHKFEGPELHSEATTPQQPAVLATITDAEIHGNDHDQESEEENKNS